MVRPGRVGREGELARSDRLDNNVDVLEAIYGDRKNRQRPIKVRNGKEPRSNNGRSARIKRNMRVAVLLDL